MRKVLVILLAGVFISGCNSNDNNEIENENNAGNDAQTEENNNVNENEDEIENEDKVLYQIGETAQIEALIYNYLYEVTVHDFELAKEYGGEELSEVELGENYRYAIANVTIKNVGDESFIPSIALDNDLIGEVTNVPPRSDVFVERDEELEPGDEITGDLVFLGNTFIEEEVFFLTYETATEKETEFELPVPEE